MTSNRRNAGRVPRWATRAGLAALSLAALAVLACRTPLTVPLDRPFALHVGQAARFANSDLELAFRRVASDSRCPLGVQCIQAGDATLTLEGRIQRGQSEAFEVRLPGGAGSADSTASRPYDGYRIFVLALEPTPVAGSPADTTAYVATLRVVKR